MACEMIEAGFMDFSAGDSTARGVPATISFNLSCLRLPVVEREKPGAVLLPLRKNRNVYCFCESTRIVNRKCVWLSP